MSTVIGIDVSLTATGICAISEVGVKSLLIPTTPQEHDFKRQLKIADTVLGFVEAANRNDRVVVAIEGYANSAFKRGSGKLFTRAEIVGMIKISLSLKYNCDIFIVQPTSLKLFICGKGNGSKQQMMDAIQLRYNKFFNDDNLADAYALCKYLQAILSKDSAATDWTLLPSQAR